MGDHEPPTGGKINLTTNIDEDMFEQVFEIYTEALPLSGQKSRSWLEEILTREDYELVVVQEDSIVAGFAIVFISRPINIALLEYMATRKEFRNRGIGAKLFQHSLSVAARSPMLVEVDSDREPCSDRLIRRRRKDFYRRLGCFQVDSLPYILPLAGKGEPPLMDLLLHLNGFALPVAKPLLRSWLITIYREVYEQPADDPRIGSMLTHVHDPILLG